MIYFSIDLNLIFFLMKMSKFIWLIEQICYMINWTNELKMDNEILLFKNI